MFAGLTVWLDHAERRFGKGSHYENYRAALKFAIDIYLHL